jgi:hypothetical protein
MKNPYSACPLPNTDPFKPNPPEPPTGFTAGMRVAKVAGDLYSILSQSVDLKQLETYAQWLGDTRDNLDVLSVNPRHGTNKTSWMERAWQSMMNATDPTSIMNAYGRTAAVKAGEVFNVLAVRPGDLGVTAARLDYTRLVERIRNEAHAVMAQYGVPKAKANELFVRMLEARLHDMSYDNSTLLPVAREFYDGLRRQATDAIRQAGLDQAGYEKMVLLVDGYERIGKEQLTVANALGANIDPQDQLGYFHRAFTPDARTRLQRNKLEDLWMESDTTQYRTGQFRESAVKKSRTTFEYLVEDELLAAEAFGFLDDINASYARVNGFREAQTRVAALIDEAQQTYATATARLETKFRDYQTKIADYRLKTQEAVERSRVRITQEFDTKIADIRTKHSEIIQRYDEALQKANDTAWENFSKVQQSAESQIAKAQARVDAANVRRGQRIAAGQSKIETYADRVARKLRGYSQTNLDKLRKSQGTLEALEDMKVKTLSDQLELAKKVSGRQLREADEVYANTVQKAATAYADSRRVTDAQLNKRLAAATRNRDDAIGVATRAHQKTLDGKIRDFQTDLDNDATEADKLLNQLRTHQAEHSVIYEEYNTIFEVPLNQFRAALQDEGEFMRLIKNMAENQSDKLDRLIDDGVLAKVPMPTIRVYEYLNKLMDTPYKAASEMMVLDPFRANELAIAQLVKDVRRSNPARSFLDDGLDNGWVISNAERLSNPAKYADFMPLKNALTGYSLDDLNIKGLEDAYVSRDVGEVFSAMMAAATRPQVLATFAKPLEPLFNLLKRSTALLKTSLLASVGFIVKNILGSSLSAFAAGADLTRIPEALMMMGKYTTGGMGAIDDTRRIYYGNTLTARDVFMEMKSNGLLGGFTWQGESSAGAINGLRRYPEDMANRVSWALRDLTSGNLKDAAGNALGVLDDTMQRGLAVYMMIGSLYEDSTKLAVALTRGSSGARTTVAQAMSYGAVKTDQRIYETVAHINKYFVNYNNIGKADTFIAQTIAPFWVWFSRNMPMQFRHMLYHPGSYVRHMRLYSLMNSEAQVREEDLPEEGVPSWLGDSSAIYVPDPLDKFNWYVIPTDGFDQVAQWTSLLTRGFFPQQSRERADEVLQLEEEKGNPLLTFFLNQTYGYIKSALVVQTNRDPFNQRTLQQPDDQTPVRIGVGLGFGTNITASWEIPNDSPFVSADKWKYILENNVPFLGRLTNVYRNNEGTAEAQARELARQNRRIVFGETPADTITGSEQEVPKLVNVLRAIGINDSEQDVVVNMQRAQAYYFYGANELQQRAARTLSLARRADTPEIAERHLQQHLIELMYADQFRESANLSEVWLNQRGYEISRDVNKVLDNASRVNASTAFDHLLEMQPQPITTNESERIERP